MNRVVVTGANGFIGLHTVRTLLAKGCNVEAVDIKTDKLDKLPDSGLSVHKMSILDENFKDLIEQGDKVLHLAAVARFGPASKDPELATRINVEGTLNIVEACIKKKAERLVYSSTGSVYSAKSPVPIREDSPREPESIYGMTKKMAEDWVMFHGNRLPYIILRYGYVYGKGKDWGAVGAFLEKIANNERPIIFGGDQTNDFIYIKDLVRINELALNTPYTNQSFNVGTGRPISIRYVCDICLDVMKNKLKPKIKPARSFDYPVFVYDISKVRTLLDFEPQYNVLNGIRDMVKEMKG